MTKKEYELLLGVASTLKIIVATQTHIVSAVVEYGDGEYKNMTIDEMDDYIENMFHKGERFYDFDDEEE